jgi:hypothetical protein
MAKPTKNEGVTSPGGLYSNVSAYIGNLAIGLGRNNSPKTQNATDSQQRSPTTITSQKTGMFSTAGGAAEKTGARTGMFGNTKT